MANKLTTIQLDEETDKKLKKLAKAYERSKMAQIRYYINRDYEELKKLKLLPGDEEADRD